MLVILSAVDPMFEKRFESLRNAAQLLPFIGKEREGKTTK
jgi:hypothetical protein